MSTLQKFLLVLAVLAPCAAIAASATTGDECHYARAGDLPFVPASALTGMELSEQMGLVPLPGGNREAETTKAELAVHVWTAQNKGDPIFQLRDIRIVHPTTTAAQQFLQGRLASLSEGAPAMMERDVDGVSVKVFGPRSEKARAFAVAIGYGPDSLSGYSYLFTVRNVVFKIFVMQQPYTQEGLALEPGFVLVRAALDAARECTADSGH